MKKEWTAVDDYHAPSIIDIFEHRGHPVIIHRGGKYPSATDGDITTREHPYIAISMYGTTEAWQVIVVAYGVYVNGQRRRLTVWDEKAAAASYDRLLDSALLHLDEAAEKLSEIDHIYDVAEHRIADGQKYKEHFMSRVEYEAACTASNVSAISDKDCQSYGVRYGDFRYPQYDPDYIVKMHLAYLRMCALDEAEEQAKKKAESEHQPAQSPRKMGQLWEPCEVCGREPAYMPLMLCDRCWPK
jgi:ribosomal protein S14